MSSNSPRDPKGVIITPAEESRDAQDQAFGAVGNGVFANSEADQTLGCGSVSDRAGARLDAVSGLAASANRTDKRGAVPSTAQRHWLRKISKAPSYGFRGMVSSEMRSCHWKTANALYDRGWIDLAHFLWNGGAYERVVLTESGKRALRRRSPATATQLNQEKQP